MSLTAQASKLSYFDAKKNGVVTEGPIFEYELNQNFKFGTAILGPDTFYVRGGEWLPDRAESGLIIRVPPNLFREGVLEIISRSGASLFAESVQSVGSSDIFVSENIFEQRVLSEDSRFFRFCLVTEIEKAFQRICTGPYGVFPRREKEREFLSVEPLALGLKSSKILVSRKAVRPKGAFKLKPGGSLEISVALPSQWSYELSTVIESPQVLEMVSEASSQNVKVFGSGPYPWGNYKSIEIRDESKLEKALKWNDTIGDFRQFWNLFLGPGEASRFYYSMPVGGNFRVNLSYKALPTEKDKPILSPNTLSGTYVDNSKIYGVKAEGTQLESKENSVETEEDSNDFIWNFRAKKKGFFNRSDLIVKSQNTDFYLTYELFKGYPGEVSLRLGGASGTKGLVLQGEGAFNYWFETLGGWGNYYLSKQRWGVSLKRLQSFSNIDIGSISDKTSSTTFDLKYRLSPGLWGRDESVGLIFGVQKFGYSRFSADLLGYGVFWARSMPEVFDQFFNLIPLLEKPKWVDVEFINYTQSSTEGVTVNKIGGSEGAGTWALNFHGKVLFDKSFFGEAGFGIRSYDFVKNQSFSFGTFYSTVGLGYNF